MARFRGTAPTRNGPGRLSNRTSVPAVPGGSRTLARSGRLRDGFGCCPGARMVGVFRHPSPVVGSLTARSGTLAIESDRALSLWCAYNTELIRLQRKYGFPVLHFGAVEAFRQDFVTPLTSFAQAIGLTGPLDRFFDRQLVHQAGPEPAPTVEARELFRQLIGISRQPRAVGSEGDRKRHRDRAPRSANTW